MDRDFITLAGEFLKKIYELTIKFPDKFLNYKKIITDEEIDESTVKRVILFLENNKLILAQRSGRVTITMKGIEKIVNEDIERYCEELENTTDPTYSS